MRVRLRNDDGFLLVELIAAMVIITVALLALLGAYDESWLSLRAGAKNSSAALIGNNQLELYASLPYANIGWYSSSTLTTAEAAWPDYSTDEATLNAVASGTDYIGGSCTSTSSLPQCQPVQTVTGGDGHTYKLETFIRLIANPHAPSGTTWNEKVVTVVVRDLSVSGDPKVVTIQTAFDSGPSS